jgi:hypothetical protein
MFIRKRLTSTKRNGEGYSYQLIETYREGGKIKQRVLYNLARCPTIEAAIEWERCKIEIAKAEIAIRISIIAAASRFQRLSKRSNGNGVFNGWRKHKPE